MRSGRHLAAGFTLIELLVALAAFGVLAAAGTAALTFGTEARDVLAARERRLGEFEIARAILKDDFAQLADRPTRNGDGARTPAFTGGFMTSPELFVGFVRRGFENPGGADTRGSLQYVEYAVEDDRLVRRSRSRLDAAGETPVQTRTLLIGVTKAKFRFYANNQWSDVWLVGGRTGPLPHAVALELELEGLGSVRQLFLTSGEPL